MKRDCSNCRYYNYKGKDPCKSCFEYYFWEEQIKKQPKFENIKKLAGEDKVNHPTHYNREDALECIDEMVLVFGKEAVKNFCVCNAWKYRYRAADKNGEEDLRKSDWYLKKYKELCDSIYTQNINRAVEWYNIFFCQNRLNNIL